MSESENQYPLFVTDENGTCFDPLYIYFPNYKTFSSENEMLNYFNDNYIIKIYIVPSLLSNIATICHTLELNNDINSVELELCCGIHIKNIQHLEWNNNKRLKHAAIVNKKTNEIVIGSPVNFKSKVQAQKIIFPENKTKRNFLSVSILKKEKKDDEIIDYYGYSNEVIEIKEKFDAIQLIRFDPNFFKYFNNYKYFRVNFFTKQQQERILFLLDNFFTEDDYDFIFLFDSLLLKIKRKVKDLTLIIRNICQKIKDLGVVWAAPSPNNKDGALQIIKEDGRYLKYFTNKEILKDKKIKYLSNVYIRKSLEKLATYFEEKYWSKLTGYVGHEIKVQTDSITVIFDRGAEKDVSLLPPSVEDFNLNGIPKIERSVLFFREDIDTNEFVELSDPKTAMTELDHDENDLATLGCVFSKSFTVEENTQINNNFTETFPFLGKPLYKKINCIEQYYDGRIGFVGIDENQNRYIATAGHVLHAEAVLPCKLSSNFHACTTFSYKKDNHYYYVTKTTSSQECYEYIYHNKRINEKVYKIEKSIDNYKEIVSTNNCVLDIGVIKQVKEEFSNNWETNNKQYKINHSILKKFELEEIKENIVTTFRDIVIDYELPVFSVFYDGECFRMEEATMSVCTSKTSPNNNFARLTMKNGKFLKGYSGSPYVCLLGDIKKELPYEVTKSAEFDENDCLLLGTLSRGVGEIIGENSSKPQFMEGLYCPVESFKIRYGVIPADGMQRTNQKSL